MFNFSKKLKVDLIRSAILIAAFLLATAGAEAKAQSAVDFEFSPKSIEVIRQEIKDLKSQIEYEMNIDALHGSEYSIVIDRIQQIKHDVLFADLRNEGCFEGAIDDCFEYRSQAVKFLDIAVDQLQHYTVHSKHMMNWALTDADTYLLLMK